ncbi:hypothetical protein D3C85_1069440 [compost metagenome]
MVPAASSAVRMSLFWVLVQRPLKLTEAVTACGSTRGAALACTRSSFTPSTQRLTALDSLAWACLALAAFASCATVGNR